MTKEASMMSLRRTPLLWATLLTLAWTGSAFAQTQRSQPVKLIMNWDEQGMWRSQLEIRRRDKRVIDADVVKNIVETAVDEHAKAGIDRVAYCAWVRFGSPVPGFKSAPFQKDYYGRAPGFETLHEKGLDQLQLLVDRCHKNGMEFFVCLRMNDRHGSARHAKFYLDHPEWRLEKFPGGLDYKYEGVRQPVLDFIAEVLERHDLDGIELDYQRWCHVFAPDEAVANTPLLNDFTRKARKIIDAAARKRGRERLRLSVRVPQTLEECHDLGFDVATWIKEGLVDDVCPSDFFFTDFNIRTEDFVKLAEGTNCKVYPSIHPLVAYNQPENIEPPHYIGAARNYYAFGAAGVSAYNYLYNWRRWTGGDRGFVDGWPKTLSFMTPLSDAKELSKLDRHYLSYPLWNPRAPTGAVKHDMIVIDRAKTASSDSLRFRVAEDLSDRNVKAELKVKVAGSRSGDAIRIAVNGSEIPSESFRRKHNPNGRSAKEGIALPAFDIYSVNLSGPPARFGDNFLSAELVRSAATVKQSDNATNENIKILEIEVIVRVLSNQ